jgi:hypothetical protein
MTSENSSNFLNPGTTAVEQHHHIQLTHCAHQSDWGWGQVFLNCSCTSSSIERILLCKSYPNLNVLGLYNLSLETARDLFTGKGPFKYRVSGKSSTKSFFIYLCYFI